MSAGSQAAGRAQFLSVDLLQTNLLRLYLFPDPSRSTPVTPVLAVFTSAIEGDSLWAAGLGITEGRGAEVVTGKCVGRKPW